MGRLTRQIQGMKPVLEDCPFLINEIELYDTDQMREVYNGIMGYLSSDQIKVFSSHKLDALQMHEIRMGFVLDLPMSWVLLYADPHLPWQLMRSLRIRLSTCRDKGIAFYFTDTETEILIERGVDLDAFGL